MVSVEGLGFQTHMSDIQSGNKKARPKSGERTNVLQTIARPYCRKDEYRSLIAVANVAIRDRSAKKKIWSVPWDTYSDWISVPTPLDGR